MKIITTIALILMNASLAFSGCVSESTSKANDEKQKQIQIRANLSEILQISTKDLIDARTGIASESTTSGVNESFLVFINVSMNS